MCKPASLTFLALPHNPKFCKLLRKRASENIVGKRENAGYIIFSILFKGKFHGLKDN